MHWDVVEVKPEADYCLFVRFKDGLSGAFGWTRESLLECWRRSVMLSSSAASTSMAAPLHGPAISTWLPTPSTGKSLVKGTFGPLELTFVVEAKPTSRS